MAEKEIREIPVSRGFTILVLRYRRTCVGTEKESLGAKGSPWGQPARKQRPQIYNKKLNSANNLNELESRFFPVSPGRSPAGQHLNVSFVKPREKK